MGVKFTDVPKFRDYNLRHLRSINYLLIKGGNMSIHPSLRRTPKDKQQRSVLKRIERVQKLINEEKWQEDKIFSLPKIKTIRMKIKKEKAAEPVAAVGTETTVAAPAGGAKPQGATPGASEKTKESTKAKPETKQAK